MFAPCAGFCRCRRLSLWREVRRTARRPPRPSTMLCGMPGVNHPRLRSGRSNRPSQLQPLRKRVVHLHHQRESCSGVQVSSSRREYRHQSGGGRPDGLLPVRRVQRLLLRRPSRPGEGWNQLLHREESGNLPVGVSFTPELAHTRGALEYWSSGVVATPSLSRPLHREVEKCECDR